MATKPQPWSGRFKEPVDERVKRFSASVGFDQRLAKQDIAGSLAHARMLAAAGIITTVTATHTCPPMRGRGLSPGAVSSRSASRADSSRALRLSS